MARIAAPQTIRTIVDLGFDFDEERVIGKEANADCFFCGGKNKLYVNIDSGMWDCKVCGLKGNTLTFLREWYNMYQLENGKHKTAWSKLSKDRGLSEDVLLSAGIVFTGEKYAIPYYNTQGQIVNLSFYTIPKPGAAKSRLFNLAGLEASIWGLEVLPRNGAGIENVMIAEGPWDGIALRFLVNEEGKEAVVLAVPGAAMWKTVWNEYVADKDVVVCYDNDVAAVKGKTRVYTSIRYKVKTFRHIDWPSGLPDGYDIRDFVLSGSTLEELQELIVPYVSESQKEELKVEAQEFRPIKSSSRPTWEQVLGVYRKHLHMTQDLEDALRLSFAVILSTSIPGNPVWLHLVAPPGSGKTLLLLSLSEVAKTYFISTLTPHSLISGFPGAKSEDPSLIPKINGKTLIVKDFTEILAMPKMHKDELYGTLRGAYDGEASKHFGNKGTVTYKSSFNIVSGVTQQIYAERSASLGERFLMFHIIKGVTFEAKNAIRAAIRNVGKELKIKEELNAAAGEFLNVDVTPEDVPSVPEKFVDRLVALAELVAVLRASVERDFRKENLLYRPQQEMGTRLATQFTKILMGLGLTTSDCVITEELYRICSRVALDSMVGFNLEAIASLMDTPNQTVMEISEDCDLAKPTLRAQLDDLVELKAVRIEKSLNPNGSGGPVYRYSLTDHVRKLWVAAHLERINGEVKSIGEQKAKLKMKQRRTITRRMKQKG